MFLPLLFTAANIDFEDSPVTVSFAPGDTTACGRIVIIDDNQFGETREVFSVQLRLPEDVPYIELGPMSTATVEVTDTPGILYHTHDIVCTPQGSVISVII